MKTTPYLLVIDDENHICESCDRIFSQAGYKVDTNISASRGFRQALTNPYDAIILPNVCSLRQETAQRGHLEPFPGMLYSARSWHPKLWQVSFMV